MGLEIIAKVRRASLKSNATMLYGHLENYADRVDQCAGSVICRTGPAVFRSLFRWHFQPENTRLKSWKEEEEAAGG